MMSNVMVTLNWKQYGKKQSQLILRHCRGQVGVRKSEKA